MKALIPQGLTRRPNYFGLLNNLMTLINCESLREIGEMACVTSAWSSRGQTLNVSNNEVDTFQSMPVEVTIKSFAGVFSKDIKVSARVKKGKFSKFSISRRSDKAF